MNRAAHLSSTNPSAVEALFSRRTLDAAADASNGRLSYYASKLPGKENWFLTDEGYVIYKNTPISRTGSQQYIGREIKKNRGYKPEWNIRDDEMVTVYRPIEEVTHPAALASFEGKSVLDLHPAGDKVLIHAFDEYDAVSKGHGSNVHIGDMTDDGETLVVADLIVKHPELNDIIDGGRRDISCGYTFLLDKDPAGRYIQREIRGNHIAVVPQGRAGSDVAIKDSAPPRRLTMWKPSKKSTAGRLLLAAGLKDAVKDATPEETADILDELLAGHGVKDGDPEEKDKDDKGAKDRKGGKDEDEHPKGCRCDDCMGSKDEHPDGCKCKDCMSGKDKKGAKDKKGGKDDDLEETETEVGDKKGGKDDAEILPVSERSESDFSVGDAIANMGELRSLVAQHGTKEQRLAFNDTVRGMKIVKNGVKDGIADPFAALTKIAAGDGIGDADPEIPMYMFFNGKSHAQGLKDYNAYVTERQKSKK